MQICIYPCFRSLRIGEPGFLSHSPGVAKTLLWVSVHPNVLSALALSVVPTLKTSHVTPLTARNGCGVQALQSCDPLGHVLKAFLPPTHQSTGKTCQIQTSLNFVPRSLTL